MPYIKILYSNLKVCTSEDKYNIEYGLGIKVINEYGASELGILAFSDREDRLSLSKEELYFEIVNDDGQKLPFGEEGKIIVTSLFNKAIPMIRYEIGDIGIIEKKGCNLYLKTLSGRTNDMAILPSGRVAAGLTFYYIAKSILEKSNMIKEFIIKQTKLNTFLFEIVGKRNLTKKKN